MAADRSAHRGRLSEDKAVVIRQQTASLKARMSDRFVCQIASVFFAQNERGQQISGNLSTLKILVGEFDDPRKLKETLRVWYFDLV